MDLLGARILILFLNEPVPDCDGAHKEWCIYLYARWCDKDGYSELLQHTERGPRHRYCSIVMYRTPHEWKRWRSDTSINIKSLIIKRDWAAPHRTDRDWQPTDRDSNGGTQLRGMARLSVMYVFQRSASVKQPSSIPPLLSPISETAVLSAEACEALAGELNRLITFKVLLRLLFHSRITGGFWNGHTAGPNDIIT